MKYLRFIALAILLASASYTCPAFADDHYVTTADLPPQLLSPPPDEGSEAWHKNVHEVIMAQHHMSPADMAALRDEQHLRLELMTSAVGPDFTRDKYPTTFALLDRVFADSEAISGADKQYWHTRRPYLTNKDVKLYVDPIDKSPSYPSGHTTGSRVLAEVLGMLYPTKLADLRERAAAIAYHRIEAGVHYPCDIDGGRMLAMLIVGATIKSSDFQHDVAAARDEIAH
jgi:acid phosphatase (class A)